MHLETTRLLITILVHFNSFIISLTQKVPIALFLTKDHTSICNLLLQVNNYLRNQVQVLIEAFPGQIIY